MCPCVALLCEDFIRSFGATALQPLAAELFEASTDGTVRASCVKAYAQIASNYPDQTFSPAAMAVLEKALSDDSPIGVAKASQALLALG